jgi:hypothetical protein
VKRFLPFTRQQAWVYGSLLVSVLGGATLVAAPFVLRHWLADGIRSRIHPGQSMPEVLAAAEEALLAPGIWAPGRSFRYYLVTVNCEDRLWALWRDWGSDGRAEFRIHVAGSDTPLPSFPERVPPTLDEVFRFAEANARGCAVDVSPSDIVLTVGDDGRVAEIKPPRR